ncbi:MAG: MaoC family dehydratase N-terminal domain-containing protein [Burkholderiaceae bacterium]
MSEPQYITDEVRALIGVQSEEQVACDAVERGAIRRMAHAIMDDDPLFWDDAQAQATRYGTVVAPPLFPVHMFQRDAGAPDPLDKAWEDPDYDGSKPATALFALPNIPIPLKRLLNAGVEVEFFRYAQPGERVTVVNRYTDIFQKQGKRGPMVFVVVERRFRNDKQQPLLIYKQTLVYS